VLGIVLGEIFPAYTKTRGNEKCQTRASKDEISRRLLHSQRERRNILIYYRSNGKQIEEKAGRQFADDMTAAKAAGIRAIVSKGKNFLTMPGAKR